MINQSNYWFPSGFSTKLLLELEAEIYSREFLYILFINKFNSPLLLLVLLLLQ